MKRGREKLINNHDSASSCDSFEICNLKDNSLIEVRRHLCVVPRDDERLEPPLLALRLFVVGRGACGHAGQRAPLLVKADALRLPKHAKLVLEKGEDAKGFGHALRLGQEVDQKLEVLSMRLKKKQVV